MGLQLEQHHLRLAPAGGRLCRAVLAASAMRWGCHRRPAHSPPDDATLAREVENELSRLTDATATRKVKAVDGVIFLGGVAQTRTEMVELGRRARAIPDVQDVVNLLHLPRNPAQMRSGGAHHLRRERSRAVSTAL